MTISELEENHFLDLILSEIVISYSTIFEKDRDETKYTTLKSVPNERQREKYKLLLKAELL